MKLFILFFFVWGLVMASDFEEQKKNLTHMQYKVTQEGGTEPPFNNQFWDNQDHGIYVDVVSKEPLFSSTHKYKSGTGWPSFYQSIDEDNLDTKADGKLFLPRTEVIGKKAKTHLGHLFNDGPKPTGKRYCINSAALEFIPLKDLDKRGYGQYKKLFYQKAIFAAGCFWGVEEIFKKVDGVIETTVGYIGGDYKNPHYEDVVTGQTGHAEAVEVVFNPAKLSYETLLGYFWRLHDPTTKDRQGVDVGSQYRSAIFYTNIKQKKIAENSRINFDASGVFKNKSVTEIKEAPTFFPAENYHQDYYEKNPGRVCHHLRDK